MMEAELQQDIKKKSEILICSNLLFEQLYSVFLQARENNLDQETKLEF